ncbi:hypothetical protein RHODOSMS8_01105 [Rhodobiaceae bacterium]|nr:hypothetical protein RHODOSMS8_01105 [Rhodobiaceae bacterium]
MRRPSPCSTRGFCTISNEKGGPETALHSSYLDLSVKHDDGAGELTAFQFIKRTVHIGQFDPL